MASFGTYRIVLELIGKDRTGNIFQRVARGLGDIFRISAAIIAANIFGALARGIGQIASEAIRAVEFFQNMQILLSSLVAREMVQMSEGTKTVGEVMGWAELKAEKLMAQIAQLSIKSPFRVEQVQEVFRMAMAFGFTTTEAVSFTEALLNVSAGIGATDDMLNRMAYNLAQVRLQGKVTALDIRQLALAGFDLRAVMKSVGEQFGLNIEDHHDFNAALEEGLITWEDFTEGFAEYAETNFGGASERMARTLQGLKSTFHDVFFLSIPKILGPSVEIITEELNKVLDWYLEFMDSGVLEQWGDRIAIATQRVIDVIKLFFSDLETEEKLRQGAVGLLSLIMPEEQAEGVVAKVEEYIGKLVNFKDRVVKLWEDIKPAFEGFGEFLKNNGPDIVKVLGDLFTTISEIIVNVDMALVEMVLTIFIELLTALGDWFAANGDDLVAGLTTLANFISETLVPALSDLGDWVVEKAEAVTKWFKEDFRPAMDAVSDWIDEKGEPVKVWLKDDFVPALYDMAAWVDEKSDSVITFFQDEIVPALNTFADWIEEKGEEATTFWVTLGENIAQLVEDHDSEIDTIASWFEERLNVRIKMLNESQERAIELGGSFWDLWENHIYPMLALVALILLQLRENVLKFAGALADKIVSTFTPFKDTEEATAAALEAILGFLGGLVDFFTTKGETLTKWFQDGAFDWWMNTLEKIKEFLDHINLALLNLMRSLEGWELPEWLQGNSPSPFENTLENALGFIRQITQEAPKMTSALENASFPGLSPTTAGQFQGAVPLGENTFAGAFGNEPSVVVPIQIDRVVASDPSDVEFMANQVMRRIQELRDR